MVDLGDGLLDVESQDSDMEDQDFGTAQFGCSVFTHDKARQCFINGLLAYPGPVGGLAGGG